MLKRSALTFSGEHDRSGKGGGISRFHKRRAKGGLSEKGKSSGRNKTSLDRKEKNFLRRGRVCSWFR